MITRTQAIDRLNIRSLEDGQQVIDGYAAVYNSYSERLWELGNRREVLLPGAFSGAIARGDDVRCLLNHDANYVLGRSKSGTLTLREDQIGLFFSVVLPDTTYARDLAAIMKRGDINQCSFAFQTDDDTWEKRDGEEVHVIRSVSNLSDVSLVAYPAFPATAAMVRALLNNSQIARLLNTSEPPNRAVDSFRRRYHEIELLDLE